MNLFPQKTIVVTRSSESNPGSLSRVRWFTCRTRWNSRKTAIIMLKTRENMDRNEEIDESNPTLQRRRPPSPCHLCDYEIREEYRKQKCLPSGTKCAHRRKYGWCKRCHLRTTQSWSSEILQDQFVAYGNFHSQSLNKMIFSERTQEKLQMLMESSGHALCVVVSLIVIEKTECNWYFKQLYFLFFFNISATIVTKK